ncbi:MAG TPA: hypothetical protein VL172_04455 [Kofleriaceae bacterium]|nr:hypothetical protein [Kofleriaceae bacterium]
MGIRLALLCSGAALWIGCGGGGEARPGPLRFHFDEYHIARVPVDERQAAFAAQNEYQIARGEQVKATADIDDNKDKLQVAENERKMAALGEQSAQSKLNSAEKSGDLNRINTAKAEQRAAEMKRRAAEQKITALKAKRDWLKKYELYAEWQMYAKEAQFELAKARVAKEKNIQPRGFRYADYDSQAGERSRQAQRSKAFADQEHQRFLSEKKKYDAMKQDAERAAGGGTGGAGAGAAGGGGDASGGGSN